MRVTYQSPNYSPELVTGRYVRAQGNEFKVFEAATGTGTFKDRPGMGYTLCEYITDGSELPEELKALCIVSKVTEKWK